MLIGRKRIAVRGASFFGSTSGRIFDLDATSITGVSDGALCSSFTDISGNSRHATQTGTARATYRATGFNGYPCLEFAGSQSMRTPSFVQAQPMTIYIACYSTDNTATNQYLFDGNGGEIWGQYYPSYGGVVIYGGGTYVAAPSSSTLFFNPGVFVFVANGTSNSSARRNGSANTGNVGAPGGWNSGACIGCYNGGAAGLKGRIARMAVFSGAHTVTQQQQGVTELYTQFNLTGVSA